MTAPTWWPRFTAWLRTAGQSLLDGLSMSVWGPEDIEYIYRRRHSEALQMSTDRTLTKTEQVRMVGNSVSPPIAAAIVRANVPGMVARDEARDVA